MSLPLKSDGVGHALGLDRATGALLGLAIGDALGMPTQLMSRADIVADYGPITSFVDAGPRQEIAAGMRAGSVTDDTEQALLLARLLVEGDGVIDEDLFGRELLLWERAMEAKGSLDLLGPSTKRAVERIVAGVPASEAGRFGSTNGAAMRITPVGIAFPVTRLDDFVEHVVSASRLTHNTSIGLSAAAAVGAAVSAGIDGASTEEIIDVAAAAADQASGRGHWVAGAHIGPKLRWAVRHITTVSPERVSQEIDEVIGTDVPAQESVVSAFAIIAATPDPWEAVCLAASVGGDTDTIAAIVGAILGARGGSSTWPDSAVATVTSVNDLDAPALADNLLQLRSRAHG